MDGQRFDRLTRALVSGSSRRQILKGFLGLGGATVVGGTIVSESDARTIGTRPTVPPPTTRPPAPPTTTTPAPCPGQMQCPNSTVCCDAGTCARSGNEAICCDGADGHGDTVCGYDCCEDPQQCCDLECCGDLAVCLNVIFPGLPEESCCPADQTCDGGCCVGDCYNPIGPELILNGFPIPPAFFARECCPPSGSVCQGTANAACCDDETEECCLREGVAVCITTGACCDDTGCPGECQHCDTTDPVTSTCTDQTSICHSNHGPCSVCMSGACFDSDDACTPPDSCTAPDCVNGVCVTTSVCAAPNSACCGQGPAGCTNLATDRFNCGACGTNCTVAFGEDGICCNGVCEDGPYCGCDVDPDCDTCELCMSGTCVSVSNDSPCRGGGPCNTCLNGSCIDFDGLCAAQCSTCFNGACVFDCADGGAETCCAATGACGDPVCDPEVGCSYVADPDECPGVCEECMPGNAGEGAYTCRPIPASDNEICRASRHPVCDPAESCDGESSDCPPDIWATNGIDCGFCQVCFNGSCVNVDDGLDPFGECGVCRVCNGGGGCRNRPDGAAPSPATGQCCSGTNFQNGTCCVNDDCPDGGTCLPNNCSQATHTCTGQIDNCPPGNRCDGSACVCDPNTCRGLCCPSAGVSTCVANAECCTGESPELYCLNCTNECRELQCLNYACNCDLPVSEDFLCYSVGDGNALCCGGECTETGTDLNCTRCRESCDDPANGVSTCGAEGCEITCANGFVLSGSQCVEA